MHYVAKRIHLNVQKKSYCRETDGRNNSWWTFKTFVGWNVLDVWALGQPPTVSMTTIRFFYTNNWIDHFLSYPLPASCAEIPQMHYHKYFVFFSIYHIYFFLNTVYSDIELFFSFHFITKLWLDLSWTERGSALSFNYFYIQSLLLNVGGHLNRGNSTDIRYSPTVFVWASECLEFFPFAEPRIVVVFLRR